MKRDWHKPALPLRILAISIIALCTATAVFSTFTAVFNSGSDSFPGLCTMSLAIPFAALEFFAVFRRKRSAAHWLTGLYGLLSWLAATLALISVMGPASELVRHHALQAPRLAAAFVMVTLIAAALSHYAYSLHSQWADDLMVPRSTIPRCPTCNYDLRATPTRCPECGAAPGGDGKTGREGPEESGDA